MSTRGGRILVAILSVTGILAALMQTIVIPLIAELPHLLDTTASNASWVITATLLSAAITTPIIGRLGDMYGKRRMLVVSVSVLGAGSIICAVTSFFPLFLFGRVLQGVATSVIPLGISILRDELRPERVPTAIALVSATLGAGASMALPLSAYLAQNFDWHIMFWASAFFSAAVLILIVTFIPESPTRNPVRFDFVGAIGLGIGLLCLLLPITKGSDWGWGSPAVLGLLAVGLLVLVVWVWFETGIKHPVVDIRISASLPVLLTNLASVLAGFAMFTNNLVLPQLLQAPSGTGYGLGQSIFVAGLCMAPSGFVMMLLSPIAGRMSIRFGPKVTLMLGLVVIATGYSLATFLMSEVWGIILMSAINGAGVGLAYAAMPGLILEAVPNSESAAANGLNTLMRSIGTTTSSAVMATVLADKTQLFQGVKLPTNAAFHIAFVIGAGAALLGLIVAFFIPVSKKRLGADDEVRPRVQQLIEEGF